MFFYKKEQFGKFYEKPKLLWFQGGNVLFYDVGTAATKIFNDNQSEDLCSDEYKVVVRLRVEFFHCLFDTLAIILYEYNKNKDTLFIINVEDSLTEIPREHESIVKFIFNILDSKNIKYKKIGVGLKTPYIVNNFRYFPMFPLHANRIEEVIEASSIYFSNKSANKKVYLSRKKVNPNRGSNIFFAGVDPQNFNFQDDIRLDDDDKVGNFFKDLGFEIVYPEDFVSMDEQIDFFSQVKTIASVTSAGLANCIFMPEKSKVIELTVPLVVGGTESLHNVYHSLSFVKKHKYVSIPSMRKSSDIIEIIQDDPDLLRFISE
jgi:hypothetical protein